MFNICFNGNIGISSYIIYKCGISVNRKGLRCPPDIWVSTKLGCGWIHPVDSLAGFTPNRISNTLELVPLSKLDVIDPGSAWVISIYITCSSIWITINYICQGLQAHSMLIFHAVRETPSVANTCVLGHKIGSSMLFAVLFSLRTVTNTWKCSCVAGTNTFTNHCRNTVALAHQASHYKDP